MDKKILIENTYADALEKAVALIRARTPNLTHRHILFVPDKYTLLAEKLLYDGTAGAFDAEVLTLNRLYFRLAQASEMPPREEPIGKLGAVLTVRRILSENEDKLDCLKQSAQSAGFAETVYNNLCQFMASGLKADDLPKDAKGATGKKLNDLILLYKAYEDATRGKYSDSAGRLRLLCALLAHTDCMRNTHVYFACYDGFTALQKQVVEKLCERAASATVVEATCAPRMTSAVETYVAPSSADELKAAAVRIRACEKNGVAYGDMGVIASGAEFNRLQRIFDEYNIPFFTDRRYALSTHPLARYVCGLFTTAAHGRNEDYIALSKNPYAGLAAEDADGFENYVYFCGIGEGGLRYPFNEPHDKAYKPQRDRAERVRLALAGQIKSVRRKEITSGATLAACVKAIVRGRADVCEIASPIGDAAQKIEEAADVIRTVYTDGSFDMLSDALATCFASVSVSVLPNRANVVEVGDVSVFRASRKKVLFVLGFHDGELPAVKTDGGLLTDRELDELSAIGAAIEPKIAERNARAEKELISVLSSADALWLSHVEGRAPSVWKVRLTQGARQKSFEEERRLLCGYARGEKSDARDRLLKQLCPTPESARELMLIGLSQKQADGVGFGCENTLREALRDSATVREYPHPNDTIRTDGLYFRHGISVSRVQEYFACPLRCFLRVGLRLQPRPDGTVSPLDLGTFLHRVVEAFVREGDFSDPERTVPPLAQKLLGEDERLQKGGDDFIAEVIAEASALCGVVASQIQKGSFAVSGAEVRFGDGEYEGIPVEIGGKIYTLDGAIDRMDVCDGAVRVIDYKTGKIDFSAGDVYYGKRIQLAIYLAAMRRMGFKPAGMFYFPFRTQFAQDNASYRLTGLFCDEYAVQMDGGLTSPEYESDVIKAKTDKNGNISKNGFGGVPASVLSGTCDYALAVLGAGAREMLSGNIAASPLTASSYDPCASCEVKPVCAARKSAVVRRRQTAVKPEFLGQAVCGEEGAEQ